MDGDAGTMSNPDLGPLSGSSQKRDSKADSASRLKPLMPCSAPTPRDLNYDRKYAYGTWRVVI